MFIIQLFFFTSWGGFYRLFLPPANKFTFWVKCPFQWTIREVKNQYTASVFDHVSVNNRPYKVNLSKSKGAYFCTHAMHPIQRRQMELEQHKQNSFHLHFRLSARHSLSLNLSTWIWNYTARPHTTRNKQENIFLCVFFFLQILLTRAIVLAWAEMQLLYLQSQ